MSQVFNRLRYYFVVKKTFPSPPSSHIKIIVANQFIDWTSSWSHHSLSIHQASNPHGHLNPPIYASYVSHTKSTSELHANELLHISFSH